MKRIISLFLAVAMLFAMGTTAFAADNGSITIDNATVGETYTIYRLFDLKSYDSTANAYSYKANSTWETWLKTQTAYLSFDSLGYATWVKDADPAAFAKAAKAYAEANSISGQSSKTATSSTVEFTGLALGYYLVDTTLGTLCSLGTTAPNVTISEKNKEPAIDKKVKEDLTGYFGDYNDADIGDVIEFKTTITAYKGAENYVVHDIMSAGLTLNKESITIQGLTKNTDYTIAFDQTCTDKNGNAAVCDFHITFAQSYLNTITDDTDITITYTATVNNSAVVGLAGNANDTVLRYSNDNSTEWDETLTYTWDMKILKYANGNESQVLAGAKFVLLNSGKTKVATFANGKFAEWVSIPTDGTWPTASVLTTDSSGNITISGIDSDTYNLREIEPPKGFNPLPSDVPVTITGAQKVPNTNTLAYETLVKKVNNQSGTVFPQTGAKGTTMFIIIGSVLAMAAVIFMVTRKKMSVYED